MGTHARNLLTVKKIESSKAAKLRDGGGLWLVTKGSGRYWSLDYRFAGKRRELGLGPLHTVTLAHARAKAEEARELVRQGIDPLEHKRSEAIVEAIKLAEGVVTFGSYADDYIDSAVKAGRWRGKKTEARWRNLLTKHAAPLRPKSLSDIGVSEVLTALRPVWGVKQETAEKLREAIERVLDSARVEGKREGDNPARWKGNLEHVLHRPDSLKRTKHFDAMPAELVPDFLKRVRAQEGVAAKALEFLVLTAARPSESREARWHEIDIENKIWHKPPERTKAGKPHRVPLSGQALKVLEAMREVQVNDYVFPGAKANRPISDTSINNALEAAQGRPHVPHGFRSTFRDWATDTAHAPREIAEAALSHAVGDAVEQAYARSDALERRRDLMEQWASFCAPRHK